LANRSNNELTSIASIVRKAIKLMGYEIKLANLTGPHVMISSNVPEDMIVAAPSASVQRSIMNILLNAIQHGRKDGSVLKVEISAAETDNEVIITIVNNGKMIPLHIQEKLLSEFIMDPSSNSGIGMFSSARSLEMIGGKITFDSDDERTEFQIKIPKEARIMSIAR